MKADVERESRCRIIKLYSHSSEKLCNAHIIRHLSLNHLSIPVAIVVSLK